VGTTRPTTANQEVVLVAEHLDACVLPRPDSPGCIEVRGQYGICPDHDGWCAPGCPVGTWEHLSIAHGFSEWTYGEFATHYPSFISPGGGVEIAALHDHDHQQHHLDHEHGEAP